MTQEQIERCQDHFEPLPCARCSENEWRGYAVLMLAGRCANGSELDHGTKWHAVKPGEYRAVCGAKPGRRSAGWSSYTVLGQDATCPRCLKKINRPTSTSIDKLIARRERLTNRRDGLTDSKIIDRIDAQLATVPAGERNDVDLLLMRDCAVLPERATQQWSTDEAKAAQKAEGEVLAADPVDTMHFDGPCPFLTCLESGPHDHPICPECGAVRYGNMNCKTCQDERATRKYDDLRAWLDMRGDLAL